MNVTNLFVNGKAIMTTRLLAIVIIITVLAFPTRQARHSLWAQTSRADSTDFMPHLSMVGSDNKVFVFHDSINQFEIELSDSSEAIHDPCISINRWNKECWLKITLPSSDSAFIVMEDESKSQIQLTEGNLKHGFYMRSRNEFEWEITLADRPDSGVLAFDIEIENLLFFYQDPDTFKAYGNNWDYREYIPGSYAVYHESNKQGIYKSGKAFHIYQPLAWDTNGDTVWCGLNIDIALGKLSVSVPDDFLDRADYPVVVDPTFGCTSQGETGVHMETNNFRHMVNYNDHQDADGEMQTAYICAYRINQSAACTATVVVYSYSPDLNECAKVVSSDKIEVTKYASSPNDAEWFNGSISGTLADDEDYLVSWQGRESCDYCLRVCADYTGTWGFERREDYSDWGTNDDLSGYSSNGFRYSVYVDCEESGGPIINPYARIRKMKRSH